jgi:ketosteroid isomerase-like protein
MSSNVEQEILKLEAELARTEGNLDVSALDRLYADDIMVTAPVGVVVDKPAVMEEVRLAASKATVGTYDKDHLKVRAYGDAAVSSYRMTVKGQFDGQEVSRRLQITNVWLKRQGRWQVVARHTASLEGLSENEVRCSESRQVVARHPASLEGESPR